MKLTDFIKPEYLCCHLKPNGKEELLKLMVSQLKQSHKDLDEKSLVENLLARENESSTGIGNQIAIPHCIDKKIKQTVCVFGQIPEGIDFESMDNKKVILAFLLVSPPGLMSEHIRLLARIARVFKEPNSVEALAKAPKDEILKIIIAEDAKIPN